MGFAPLRFIRLSVWRASRQFARVVPCSTVTQADVLMVASVGVVLGIGLLSDPVVLVVLCGFCAWLGRDYLKVRSRAVEHRSKRTGHTAAMDLQLASAVGRAEFIVVVMAGIGAYRSLSGGSPLLGVLVSLCEVAVILVCAEEPPGGTTVWPWLADRLRVGVPSPQPATVDR